MRMRSTRIDEEFLVHGIAEFVFRQHAFHSDLHEALWFAAAHLSDVEFLLATRVPGIMLVLLGVFFIPGEADLIGIDDDDEVSGVHVRSVLRVVLAAEDSGDFGAEAAQNGSISVDDEPTPVDFLFLDRPGLVTQSIHGK